MNFARRDKCNKCGAPSPAGSGDNHGSEGGNYSRGGGGRYGDSRGEGDNYDSGRGGGSYGGRDGGGYNQSAPSYAGSGNNYPPPANSYNANPSYDADNAVPPPSSYTGGPTSYPPSYGTPTGYGGDAIPDSRGGGRGGPPGGQRNSGGSYDAAPVETEEKVKQCDDKCDDTCDNSRIYISNLPPDVTVDELQQLFGMIGQVARIKQKRGYKDQWPWNIKIYTDEKGKSKGDGCVVYEDPSAAHSAGGFYNNHDMRGYKITVGMAEKSAPRPPPAHGQGYRAEIATEMKEAAENTLNAYKAAQLRNTEDEEFTTSYVTALKKENEMLKKEKEHLERRVDELLERCQNISVEEYNRMKLDVQHMQRKLEGLSKDQEDTNKALSKKLEDSRFQMLEKTVEKLSNDLRRQKDAVYAMATVYLSVENSEQVAPAETVGSGSSSGQTVPLPASSIISQVPPLPGIPSAKTAEGRERRAEEHAKTVLWRIWRISRGVWIYFSMWRTSRRV